MTVYAGIAEKPVFGSPALTWPTSWYGDRTWIAEGLVFGSPAPMDKVVWQATSWQPSRAAWGGPLADLPDVGRSFVASRPGADTSEVTPLIRVPWPIAGMTWEEPLGGARSEASVGSTAYQEAVPSVGALVEVAFGVACEETFEDGMESAFSKCLVSLVKNYNGPALDAVAGLVSSGQENGEVMSQALRSLGEMHDPRSYGRRLQLLVECLRSPSLWVRDGATIGLAWLDDPAAIPSLKRAVEQEAVEELRRNMEAVLAQLEETRLCR